MAGDADVDDNHDDQDDHDDDHSHDHDGDYDNEDAESTEAKESNIFQCSR